MKKVLLGTSVLLLSTSSAFASKSIMTALSQDSERGSFIIEDNRNIFHNPAHVRDQNNYVLGEWGDKTGSSGTGAEGGYFRKGGSISYGLYLGADIDRRTHNDAKNSNSITKSDDLIDLMVAGGDDMKWGVGVTYGKNKTAANAKNDFLGFSAGIISESMGMEIFASGEIKNESITAGTGQIEGDTGYRVGLTKDVMGYVIYAEYGTDGYDEKDDAGTATDKQENTRYSAGIGRSHEVRKGAKLITELEYDYVETTTGVGTTTETKSRGLNLNIGFEAAVYSWLTWRGGVTQDLTSEVFGASETANTIVNAGASLNFNHMRVDGNIGTSSATVGTNDFFSAVAVSYWF